MIKDNIGRAMVGAGLTAAVGLGIGDGLSGALEPPVDHSTLDIIIDILPAYFRIGTAMLSPVGGLVAKLRGEPRYPAMMGEGTLGFTFLWTDGPEGRDIVYGTIDKITISPVLYGTLLSGVSYYMSMLVTHGIFS